MRLFSKWISTSARYSNIYYNRQFEEWGFGSGQYFYILVICDHPGMRQDDLTAELSMNKGTVARVVATLEREKFITRQVNEKDKRVYNLYPTEKALKMYPEIIRKLDSWNVYLSEGLSEEEEAILEGLLIKLMNNAKKYAKIKEE